MKKNTMGKLTIAALLVVTVLFSLSFEDKEEAERVLKMNGYTNIEFTGHAWFKCAENESISTGFKADNPTGQKVEGTVCSSWGFKGSTIRF